MASLREPSVENYTTAGTHFAVQQPQQRNCQCQSTELAFHKVVIVLSELICLSIDSKLLNFQNGSQTKQ